jgi:ketosteroid isomerase-like protein
MTNSISRAGVDTFYRAYISRDPIQIAATLDEDVEWSVAGPAELMQVCGYWRGKAAVVDRFTRIVPSIIEFKGFNIEHLLIDEHQSAAFGNIACVHRGNGRLIRHRVAHFVLYREAKVVSFHCINDSFDAVEQFVGHQIIAVDEQTSPSGNLIGV